MRTHVLLTALLLCALFAASSPAQDTPSVAPANAPAETVSVEEVADDSAIEKRLTKIYAAAEKAGWLTNSAVILATRSRDIWSRLR